MAIVATHLVKKKQNIDFECDRKLKVSTTIEIRLVLLLCDKLLHPEQDQPCSVQTRSDLISSCPM